MMELQDFGVFYTFKNLCYDIFSGDGEGVPCYVEPPVIAGHEFSGRVVKLGNTFSIHFSFLNTLFCQDQGLQRNIKLKLEILQFLNKLCHVKIASKF